MKTEFGAVMRSDVVGYPCGGKGFEMMRLLAEMLMWYRRERPNELIRIVYEEIDAMDWRYVGECCPYSERMLIEYNRQRRIPLPGVSEIMSYQYSYHDQSTGLPSFGQLLTDISDDEAPSY